MSGQLRRRRSAHQLIDQEVLGDPWKLARNVEALRAGNYIFCARADPLEDGSLNPKRPASSCCTSACQLQGPQARSRPRRAALTGRSSARQSR